MTDAPRPIDDALEEHDVTLAVTPRQLLLLVIGIFVLLRLVRRLRA